MKKILIILLLIGFSQTLSAQNTVFEEKRTIYKREQSFGLVVHTRGWGITYRYGQYTSGFTRRTFEGEIVGMKHPKEIKTYYSPFDNSNGYDFGKLNSIIILRGSIGSHRTFISKQSVRGIAISSILNVGFSLAYAKPVYLEINKIDSVDKQFYTDVEKYDPDVHTQADINGRASWFRGLFGGKIYPGGFIKAGLNFESSRDPSRINALEVGAVLDIYFQKIPIMANEFNQPYFFNLYVSLTFGSKKTE